MNKKLHEIFDEAKPNELDRFSDELVASDLPPETLSSVKDKVYEKTGLKTSKKSQKRIWTWFGAIAACLILIASAIIIVPMLKEDTAGNRPLSYEIIERNGEYFIKISGDPLPHDENESYMRSAGLHFESIEEMLTEVTEYKLKEEKIDDMRIEFSSGENEELPILNIYDPYVPVLPDGLKYSDVTWFGTYYDVSLADSEEWITGGLFEYCGEAAYDLCERYKIENRFADDPLEGTHVEDRNSEVYIYISPKEKQYKYICYTITNASSDTELYIQEEYLLKSPESNDSVSEEIPKYVYIFGTSKSEKFFVLMEGFEERPSAEWLSSFGLQRYSES